MNFILIKKIEDTKKESKDHSKSETFMSKISIRSALL